MKTAWDYTELAASYLKRPDYAPSAIDALLARTLRSSHADICDVGAGVAHLTLPLLARGHRVTAVEPNDAMRALGIQRTQGRGEVRWVEGTGEQTGLASASFDLVTFGSSFNVTDRPRALVESARILRPRGWFACMWNHRDLDDPLQARIEAIIRKHVPSYDYGARREDQTAVIDASGLFEAVATVTGSIVHEQSSDDCIEAWRSHATLARQAGAAFAAVVGDIAGAVKDAGPVVRVPYATRVYFAQRRT